LAGGDPREAVVHERDEAQLAALERVRAATRATKRLTIEPVLTVDLPGTCVPLPLLTAVREPT